MWGRNRSTRRRRSHQGDRDHCQTAVLRGALSLLAGAGGVDKSTVATFIAATVTADGAWPDGSRAKFGGVIFCEGEDDPASVTLPRLKAAGADLSRLAIGSVCDLPVSAAALDALGEVSLLVLSPVRSFFGRESYVEMTVRERSAPVLPSSGPRAIFTPPAAFWRNMTDAVESVLEGDSVAVALRAPSWLPNLLEKAAYTGRTSAGAY